MSPTRGVRLWGEHACARACVRVRAHARACVCVGGGQRDEARSGAHPPRRAACGMHSRLAHNSCSCGALPVAIPSSSQSPPTCWHLTLLLLLRPLLLAAPPPRPTSPHPRYELLYGRSPFAGGSRERTFYNIANRGPDFPPQQDAAAAVVRPFPCVARVTAVRCCALYAAPAPQGMLNWRRFYSCFGVTYAQEPSTKAHV